MLKNFYFEPCLLQVLSTFCVLISIINPIGTLSPGYATNRILWQILQFLQAIYAKIVESIQVRRIRVKLSIADQRPKGKKSRKCQEIGAVGNLAGCEIFTGCEISQVALFIMRNLLPACHYSCLMHTVHFSHTVPAACLKFCLFCSSF